MKPSATLSLSAMLILAFGPTGSCAILSTDVVQPSGPLPTKQEPAAAAHQPAESQSSAPGATEPEFRAPFAGELSFVQKVVKKGSEEAGYEIDVRYPQLAGPADAKVRTFNQGIERTVYERYRWVERASASTRDTELPGIDRQTITFDIIMAEPDGIISVSFFEVTIGAGAGSAYQHVFSKAFDFRTGRFLTLKELFKPEANYLAVISKACREVVERESATPHGRFYGEPVDPAALEPRAENFKAWTITPTGIAFGFDECVLRSCMHGAETIAVPFAPLAPALRANSPLSSLVP
jgi:hypothetical protein